MTPDTAELSVPDAVTHDALLGGRVRLCQPALGYRVAVDPVLLAAAVPVRPGERAVDLGAGTGAVALCLAARLPRISVTGLERDPSVLALAREGARLSGLEGRVAFVEGDAMDAATLLPGETHHVLVNPPYLDVADGTVSPHRTRRSAGHGDGIAVEDWADAALSLLERGGSVTLIHRADRLDRLISALTGRAGEITVFPLWPRAGVPAKRVLVQARKEMRGGSRLLPGLVLHGDDGKYTGAAEAVLRDAAPLDLRN